MQVSPHGLHLIVYSWHPAGILIVRPVRANFGGGPQDNFRCIDWRTVRDNSSGVVDEKTSGPYTLAGHTAY